MNRLDPRWLRSFSSSGFTLIELMMVVSIVGLLSCVAIPVFTRSIYEAKTAEGAILLGNTYRDVRRLYETKGTYSWYGNNIAYEPLGATSAGRFAILNGPMVTGRGFGLKPDDSTRFMIGAVANLDADRNIQLMAINEKGNISTICDDFNDDEVEGADGFEFYFGLRADCTRMFCPGDANGDGSVNGADLTAFSPYDGPCTAGPSCADFNGDGYANFSDLVVIAQNFGHVCDLP